MQRSGLIEPHGGKLVDLMVRDDAAAKRLIEECEGRAIQCSDRNACDVELLCVGGFSPLQGFMNEARRAALLACPLPVALFSRFA